jgi:diguanylate cyclase (GGDEF)-like protein
MDGFKYMTHKFFTRLISNSFPVIKLILLFAFSTLSAQTLTFGVFTYRTPEKIMEEYLPIAEHLSRELNVSVLIRPLSQEELEKEVAAGKIDIVATNPTHYLSLQKQGKTTGAIATLVKRYNNVATPYLGGVIITRAGRNDIRSLSDLKGKTVAIPGKKFLGGYQTQDYALLKAGVVISKDVTTVACGNHVEVVNAVLSQKADAGFIRSGILEEMMSEKKLNLQDIFIVNEKILSHFPMKLSTNLYPEWSVVAAKEVDVDTVSKIAVALYGYHNPKIGSGVIAGFTIPGDYADIDTLARVLRIPPYDHIPPFTIEDIWDKHGIALAALVSITTLFFIMLSLLYRRAKFEKEYAQSILNATPTPIIVTDGAHIVSANTSFLNFVEFETLEAFKSKHDSICDLYEEGDTDEYLRANMNDKTWIEHIIVNPEHEHKVKITINGITTFFKVDVSVVQSKGSLRAIAIFDDISELVNQSTTDALTRIANRTHFNLLYEHSLYIAKREKTPLSLIFFDIDHFKAVNDTYGHLVGDDVLRHLANLAKNSLRKSDIVARWGGEEFIIVLPNTSLTAASHLAQELRKTIESEEFAVVEHLTCSFGVAQLQENEDAKKLLLRIDELLYSAKENGRNRVEIG